MLASVVALSHARALSLSRLWPRWWAGGVGGAVVVVEEEEVTV